MRCPTKILILGNYRNALTVARKLGTQHQVILGGTGGGSRVGQSRFVAETWPLPDAGSDRFPDALESLLHRTPDAPVLFPIGDIELYGLLRVPSVVDGTVKAVMPQPGVVAECLDKAALVDLARKLRIPQANYRKVTQLSELREAVREVGCPCIIKSDHQLSRAFGSKAYPISSLDELADLIDHEPDQQHGLIVQAVAKGLRHNVYFAADRGRLVAAMEARVLRTDIFDGSGYTVESKSVPLSDDLRRHTESLIATLEYHGIGNTQFLVDRALGEISFLEISPRMGAAFAITVPCGFDFAHAGLSLAVGDPLRPESLPRDYPSGRRLAWSLGDLAGLINASRRGDIRPAQVLVWLWRLVLAALSADIHTTWSWRDPKPTVAIAFAAARDLWRLVSQSAAKHQQ